MLSVNGLTKMYQQHQAVQNVSFDLEYQQCVALLGPNGAGKTTTLQMLSGLLAPTSGRIRFLGRESINRLEIGYLPQHPAFFSWMTALEYMVFAARLSKMKRREALEKSRTALRYVGLEKEEDRKIGGFSGGMKQRLGLAQALVHEPRLLILDEPVSALDPAGRREVLDMMKDLKKKMTILFSTHVLHDAEEVCDQVIMLKEGAVKWSGPLHRLKNRHLKPSYILTAEESLEGWLEHLPYVSKVMYHKPSQAEFYLTDRSDSRRLLAECLNRQVSIVRFEQKTMSLEDMYLKVMGL
ncbi:ABC transporter ATP-binding protein [Bacillus haynesii]|uniref:ABC transporter ATP-binding protein n=1 Tax=Bacillus haynesii TaxID=1925021 RepID=UPI001C239A38|nr:ABC transporter ATP-binding protein [Bacillus haynesii]MBU8683964.1 ABC transporter ATP-binding protein [Bacillus haynesii]MCY8435701.1 ABC transporter ATP-binding protein [Bacillus haynesii]MCY8542801.1 ABC transporter ATP-binding protein [Bacillus haynesii]MCY8580848.1 ABC transporter ATP-binding protein [Bacillus haynesii]MCY9155324.1 ABC transporter ATP-binding protein [Bacillus haynesii]